MKSALLHGFNIFRSAIFYVGYSCFFTVQGLILIPVAKLIPSKILYRLLLLGPQFNVAWVKICCGVSYSIEGLENIEGGSGVVLSKHQSSWETHFLQSLFYPQSTVIKKELLKIPIFGQILNLTDPIVMDRENPRAALKELLKKGSEKLEKGYWVVLFPEGTRVMPGDNAPFFAGGASLAVKNNTPITPIAHNAGDFWPANSLIKRPGQIRVVIGKPIEVNGRKAKDVNDEVEQWIASQMKRISSK